MPFRLTSCAQDLARLGHARVTDEDPETLRHLAHDALAVLRAHAPPTFTPERALVNATVKSPAACLQIPVGKREKSVCALGDDTVTASDRLCLMQFNMALTSPTILYGTAAVEILVILSEASCTGVV